MRKSMPGAGIEPAHPIQGAGDFESPRAPGNLPKHGDADAVLRHAAPYPATQSATERATERAHGACPWCGVGRGAPCESCGGDPGAAADALHLRREAVARLFPALAAALAAMHGRAAS